MKDVIINVEQQAEENERRRRARMEERRPRQNNRWQDRKPREDRAPKAAEAKTEEKKENVKEAE